MLTLRKIFLLCVMGMSAFAFISTADANDTLSLFPMGNYDQTIATWIQPANPDYDKPWLSADKQKARLDVFYAHYFGDLSPWNADYAKAILEKAAPDSVSAVEDEVINNYDNSKLSPDKMGYGENFLPYDQKWLERLRTNTNMAQFAHLRYQSNNRGIVVDNTHARLLPTDDVFFYSHRLAGQGFPFDNLQMSAVWAGTPVYIIGGSLDQAWMLVITPDYITWVKSNTIARVDDSFVATWTKTAKNKLVAITRTQTSVTDTNGKFLFSAYIGSVFPGYEETAGSLRIMVPVANVDRNAIIRGVLVAEDSIAAMPIEATPHNFATVIQTLIGRSYGWGGEYFFNDCSAELKSLFTPFGIWLPRHSSEQMKVSRIVDMSSSTAQERLNYLVNKGHPFSTLVYIGGHILLYVGKNPNKDLTSTAMTYQNMWGLSPNPADRRAVIGKAVFFPLLLSYPEDPSLGSLAAKRFFQLSDLNELSDWGKLTTFDLFAGEKAISVRALMFSDELPVIKKNSK